MVSVIIPIYNAEKYLERCVQSVLNQTVTSLEVILVNDGSTDKSLEICERIKKKDSRVCVIDKMNEGVSEARNTGINLAKGEFIFFVDSDDWIEPVMLEKLLEKANMEEERNMVVCAHYCENLSGEQQEKWNVCSREREWNSKNVIDCVANMEETRVFSYLWNKIYQRKIIEKHNIRFEKELATGEDLVFNLKYFKYVKKCEYLCEPLYHYIKHGTDSQCAKYKKRLYEMVQEVSARRYSFYNNFNMLSNERYRTIYEKMYIECFMVCVPNMYRKNAHLTHRQRREEFRKIMSTPRLREYCQRNNDQSKIGRLFIKNICRQNPVLSEMEYSFLFFIRNNLSGLYEKIKK